MQNATYRVRWILSNQRPRQRWWGHSCHSPTGLLGFLSFFSRQHWHLGPSYSRRWKLAFLTVGLPYRRSAPRRGFHIPHARDTTGVGTPMSRDGCVLADEQKPAATACRFSAPVLHLAIASSCGLSLRRRHQRFTHLRATRVTFGNERGGHPTPLGKFDGLPQLGVLHQRSRRHSREAQQWSRAAACKGVPD
jgi:hypothetical protein